MIFYYLVNFNSNYKNKELIPVFIPRKNSLKEDEWKEIENKSLIIQHGIKFKINNYNTEISKIEREFGKYFEAASERIIQKIKKVTSDLSNDIDGSITQEMEKVSDSYGKRIKEFEEQLERQVCQMKWFNKDMRSAITRTRNNIAKETAERDEVLSGYKNYMNMQYSIEMLSAGILIAVK